MRQRGGTDILSEWMRGWLVESGCRWVPTYGNSCFWDVIESGELIPGMSRGWSLGGRAALARMALRNTD